MKAIAISQSSKFFNELLQQAREQNLILQSPDGEQFVLAKIADKPTLKIDEDAQIGEFKESESDDFEEEIALTRQNKALMRFLDDRAARSEPGTGISLEEIRQSLG